MSRAVEKELSVSGGPMKTAADSIHRVRAELMRELEHPDSFQGFVGHKPCCSGHLDYSSKQGLICRGASIDMQQKTVVVGVSDRELHLHESWNTTGIATKAQRLLIMSSLCAGWDPGVPVVRKGRMYKARRAARAVARPLCQRDKSWHESWLGTQCNLASRG